MPITQKNFSPRASRLIKILARDEAVKLASPTVDPEHLILGMLKSSDGLGYLALRQLNINILKMQLHIEQRMTVRIQVSEPLDLPRSPRLYQLFQAAALESDSLQCNYIGTEHLLLAAISEPGSATKDFFESNGITLAYVKDAVRSVEKKIPSSALMSEEAKENPQMNSENPQAEKINARAKTNVNANEPFLSQFSRDLTDDARLGKIDPIIGRNMEIQRVVQILSRKSKNNPILVGEPGVGKTAVVEGLARMIAENKAPGDLNGKRIISLDMAAIVAGTKYRGDFEERMKRIMKEIKNAKDIILFIDELHSVIGAGGSEGQMDASNMLKPALGRGELQIIGATTTKEYRKYVEKNGAFARRFQMVQVNEPGALDTETILNGIKGSYEDYHKVYYEDDVVETIVRYASRYIPERFMPDKAIDILDEAGAVKKLAVNTKPQEIVELEKLIVDLNKEKTILVNEQNYEKAAEVRDKVKEIKNQIDEYNSSQKEESKSKRIHVTREDVCTIISQNTGIPVDQLSDDETKRLIQMEENIHKEVIGQEAAVSAIASAVRRSRAGISSHKRPLGSFIFLGPTGVGKTQLAKSLAKFLFGSEDSLIRVDMSDYMEKHNASRLVGAPPGYVGFEEGGTLTEQVRQRPYSVVLLDEIEKAHSDIFNLLLQMLEEGELKDSLGHTVSFKNCLVLMTSNAGARQITQENKMGFSRVKEGLVPYEEIKASALEELKHIMTPELLNRVDDIVVFNALSKDEVSKILDIQLADLDSRLAEKDLHIEVKPKAREYFVENGYEPSMGARPMRRLLQQKIEDPVASLILGGTRKKETIINVDYKNEEITVAFAKTKKAKAITENSEVTK